jgi:hypothetical protein
MGQSVIWSLTPTSKLPSVISLLMCARQLGLALGPAIGGMLYGAGGFPLPLLVGSCMFLVQTLLSPCAFSMLAQPPVQRQDAVSMFQMFRTRNFYLMTASFFLREFGTDLLASLIQVVFSTLPRTLSALGETRADHMVEISATSVGALVSISAAFNIIGAGVSGQIVNKYVDCTSLQALSFGVWTFAFLLIGPSHLFQSLFMPSAITIAVGLAVSNAGLGLIGPCQPLVSLRLLKREAGEPRACRRVRTVRTQP